jgi:DNA polymerase-1
VFCDYSFVELCTLAQTCLDLFGWSTMAEAINAGLDPHLDMAASMLGIDYTEAVRRKKADDKEIAEYRQLSKALNFGYPGGLGASKFCDYARAGYGVTVSETDARKRKEDWYRKWPEMRLFHQHFGSMGIGDQTFAVTQLPSGRVRGGVMFTAACNTMFQGRAADGAKRAGWYITQETYLGYGTHWPDDGRPPSPLYGSRMCLFVHDEFIIEAPEDRVHDAAHRLSEVMIIGMREVVPAVKIGTEFAAARRWYKGASAVYDENKRLIPWEPKAKK